MKKKKLFITLDGVDGVGKTTVAKILAAEGFFQYHKSPSGYFTTLRKEIDMHATPLERYCFYRLATQFDSEQINCMLQSYSVVCDRYIASTTAYHIAMDPRIRNIHNEKGILQPHFSFLLSARPEIRDHRILQRNELSSDRAIERNSKFLNSVEEIFMSLNLINIDTSDLTANEVGIIIRNIIKEKML